MRKVAAVLAASAAAFALAGCWPADGGGHVVDGHGNRIFCEEQPDLSGPLSNPTPVPVECVASPPAPPSISPSPVVTVSPSPVPAPSVPALDVKGGYYLSGQANMTADVAGMNLESFTQYRSLGSRLVFPGYEPNYGYLTPWVNAGVVGNFVVENTCFNASDCTARTFTVEGTSYTVPASNMTQNRCPGWTPENAYGYGQITSGALDGLLHTALAQTRTFTGPLIWHIYSEIDTDAECGVVEGSTTYDRAASNARAAAAAVYMMDWLRDPPGSIAPVAANVRFTVGMGGFHAASYDQVYTAAVRERVDMYNFNTYWRSASSTWQAELNNDLANVRKSGWPVKPVVVAEYGTPVTAAAGTWTNTQADRIELLARAVWDVNRAASNDSDIEIINYFNSNAAWATLNPKPEGLAALRRAYNDTLFSRQGE